MKSTDPIESFLVSFLIRRRGRCQFRGVCDGLSVTIFQIRESFFVGTANIAKFLKYDKLYTITDFYGGFIWHVESFALIL